MSLAQSVSAPFQYPILYSLPAFYTLQPNLTTRNAQLTEWSSVLLAYAAHHRFYKISATHAIFTNSKLKRALSPADARVLLAHMIQHNLADPINALSHLYTSSAITVYSQLSDDKRIARSKAKDGESEGEVWLWWKTPEEWAGLIIDWIDRTGQKGSVLTFYELSEGEATEGEEFHGLPSELLGRIVAVLVKRGKAAVLGEGEGLGVKVW